MFCEKAFRSKWLAWGVVGAVSLLFFPCEAISQAKTGAMMGFIYADDAKKPVEGAVVKLRSVQDGKEFQSGPTDKNGMYALKGIAEGRYMVGVSSKEGDFNFDYELLVKADETAKLSLALKPQISGQQTERGETRIGYVFGFSLQAGEAEVYLERGLLQIGDRIHVKGATTDFYQDVKSLKSKGAAVDKALAGRNFVLALEKAAISGDIIYVVWKQGVPPAFLTAKPFFGTTLGIITIVGASALLVYGGLQIIAVEEEESPSKK